jgi:putative endonuclease
VAAGSTKGDGRGARGRLGEAAAQALLERQGYVIVDVNVRFGKTRGLSGEIDIVAWDGPVLCFVEVKTRRAAGRSLLVAPAEAVTPAKQRQIARLALAYANQHGLLFDDGLDETGVALRFDVVAVVLDRDDDTLLRRADLIRGAFLAPDDIGDAS